MHEKIFVHVGQCGCQIGAELWNWLSAPHRRADRSLFREEHNGDLRARAILLDAEPKPPRLVSSQLQGLFHPRNVIWSNYGCGNNWAVGYEGKLPCRSADTAALDGSLVDSAIERIRRELEHCDLPGGLVVTQSAAGGTGSGAGSLLLEQARELLGTRYAVSAMVLPFRIGDAPVKYYNTILALATALENADAVVAFDNELLWRTQSGERSRARSKARPLLRDDLTAINSSIARTLARVFGDRGRGDSAPLADMVSAVTPLPSMRLCAASSRAPTATKAPSIAHDWEATITQCLKSHPAVARSVPERLQGRISASAQRALTSASVSSAQVVLRGIRPRDLERAAATARDSVSKVLSGPRWNPAAIDIVLSAREREEQSVSSVAAGGGMVLRALEALAGSQALASSGAFLHWYERALGADAVRERLDHAQHTILHTAESACELLREKE